MESAVPNSSGQQEPVKPKKDPLDVMLDHVTAARDYGYSYMMTYDIIELIKRAKEGTLGDFKPNFS